jgi:NADPH-dependent curcumin reductase CurA
VGVSLCVVLYPVRSTTDRVTYTMLTSELDYFGGVTQLKNWLNVVIKRMIIQGFWIFDYMDLARDATAVLLQAVNEGKLNILETETIVQKPFEELPAIWATLFEGTNIGKTIVQIASL